MYIYFQQSTCLTFTVMAPTTELNYNGLRYNYVSSMYVLNALSKSIIYTCPARNYCDENDMLMKIM